MAAMGEWISVEDRLPAGGYVLVAWDYDGVSGIVGEAFLSRGVDMDGTETWEWMFPFYSSDKDVIPKNPHVTHWQSMPKSPEGFPPTAERK